MTGGRGRAESFLGVDIGGTRMTAGLVGRDGALIAVRRMTTPRSVGADACLAMLLEACRSLLDEAGRRWRPSAVGIGFGGPVDAAAGVIRRSHHVRGWAGRPLAEIFSQALSLPAYLENDANAGALAEALFGAGRGYDPVLYVNVGTGIGGGLVVGGRVHRGAHFNAGEIGHLVLVPGGPKCPCGKRGCLEALASGDAIGRMARQRRQAGLLGDSALAITQPLTGQAVGEYAARGDETARKIVAEAGGYLGWALALSVNLLDPEIVVVGGGVSALGDVYLGPARRRFRQLAMRWVRGVNIVPAALGYDAGVIGAAAVAMMALNA
ncbi:MAG: ROK family protein [Armatimonadetes bacterium]|nr:ROK family protein [Armatimonadota bacterium]